MYLSTVKVHRLTSSVITNAQVLPSSRSDKFVKSLRNSLCGSNRSLFTLSLCENSLLSSPLLILFILSWICFFLFTHSVLARFIHLQENELNSKKEFNLIPTLSVTTGDVTYYNSYPTQASHFCPPKYNPFAPSPFLGCWTKT